MDSTNHIKTFILLATLSALLFFVSNWIIGGVTGFFTGIMLVGISNFAAWYLSDGIALASYGAIAISEREAPEIYAIVERLSQRAGIPTPQVYMIPSPAANAFATGRDPEHAAVALTEGILEILRQDELEGVIAHELSHIRHRDTLTQAVAGTIAGAISFLAQMASYGLWFSGGSRNHQNANIIGLILTIILAPIAATIIQLAISRTREFEADAGAALLTRNPRALARALQSLELQGKALPLQGNPAYDPLLIMSSFSSQFLANLFSTHPSTQARVENLLRIEQEL